jgi:hypothetical protein
MQQKINMEDEMDHSTEHRHSSQQQAEGQRAALGKLEHGSLDTPHNSQFQILDTDCNPCKIYWSSNTCSLQEVAHFDDLIIKVVRNISH